LSALHTSSDERLFRTQYAAFYITLQGLSAFLFVHILKNGNPYADSTLAGYPPALRPCVFFSTDGTDGSRVLLGLFNGISRPAPLNATRAGKTEMKTSLLNAKRWLPSAFSGRRSLGEVGNLNLKAP